jgi:hypothetical protein
MTTYLPCSSQPRRFQRITQPQNTTECGMSRDARRFQIAFSVSYGNRAGPVHENCTQTVDIGQPESVRRFPGVLLFGIVSPAVNYEIAIDAACQSEFAASTNLLDTHRLDTAPQIDYLIRITRVVSGYNNIALDSLTWPHRLIQEAIEAVSADVSGLSAKRVASTTTP